ncbi:hypothetical protein C8R45DRAFT_981789 [Mycena sanguinolenta]|nr:hypothetical protein C8R45DRAFT_981789 [Mycena sanguinolenta]
MPPALLYVRSSQNATILDATGSSSSPNTTVAMSILYAVTGIVSFLFFMIIISGAIKAIRHPERYGPRRNHSGEDGWSQTRAGGLTRAILDTFPIIKFGSTTQETPESQTDDDKPSLPAADTAQQSPPAQSVPASRDGGASLNPDEKIPSSSIAESPAGVPGNAVDTIPAGIGRETCPICIVDFEEGDDLRVLPCDGAHCFHKSCVDPWLLELSTACPLCRHDFIALENLISGGEAEDSDFNNHRTSRLRRFSKYLRFSRNARDQDGSDTTRFSTVDVTAPSPTDSGLRQET